VPRRIHQAKRHCAFGPLLQRNRYRTRPGLRIPRMVRAFQGHRTERFLRHEKHHGFRRTHGTRKLSLVWEKPRFRPYDGCVHPERESPLLAHRPSRRLAKAVFICARMGNSTAGDARTYDTSDRLRDRRLARCSGRAPLRRRRGRHRHSLEDPRAHRQRRSGADRPVRQGTARRLLCATRRRTRFHNQREQDVRLA